MHIAWADLGLVLAIGLVLGAGVSALYALGVRVLATDGLLPPVRYAAAGGCFAVCAAAVGVGVYTLL